MADITDVKVTKSAESGTEAKVFNSTEKYMFFKFAEEASKLLVVYIRNLDTDGYFKFPIEPGMVNRVFSQTDYYYMKFDLSPVFEKQNGSVQKWRIDVYEQQGNEFIKIKEHLVTLNKAKGPVPFVFTA